MRKSVLKPKRQADLIEEPGTPSLFADEMAGIAWAGGVMRLTLTALRFDAADPSGPTRRVIAGRIAMPIASLEGMIALLVDTLGKMKQQDEAEGRGSSTVQ